MKPFRYCLTLVAAVVWIILLSAAPARSAEQEHEIEVGKNDDVRFTAEMKIGSETLAPGVYRLQHRSEGQDHSIQFSRLGGVSPRSYTWVVAAPGGAKKAGQASCRVEPLDQKVDKTSVYSRKENGAERVTKILVRGENVAHIF